MNATLVLYPPVRAGAAGLSLCWWALRYGDREERGGAVSHEWAERRARAVAERVGVTIVAVRREPMPRSRLLRRRPH